MKRILVIIFVVFLLAGCADSTGGTSGGKITKAEYDQIENGMTYEEVIEIIGSEGQILSEVGEKDDELYTFVVMWEGEGDIGANANFTFQGGKLQAKAQIGLK